MVVVVVGLTTRGVSLSALALSGTHALALWPEKAAVLSGGNATDLKNGFLGFSSLESS